MRRYPAALLFFMLTVALFLLATVSCSDDTPPSTAPEPHEVQLIEPGHFTVDEAELFIGTNSNTDNDLWIVAGNPEGEGVGVLAHRDSLKGTATIYGVMYSDSSGNSFTALLDSLGRPDTVTFIDESKIIFTEYTASSATVKTYNESGVLSGTESISLGNDYTELLTLVKENGLTVGDSPGLAKNAATLGKISEGSLTLKIAGNIISVVGCAGTSLTAVTGFGAVVAIGACVSAGQGVVSTVLYIAGDDSTSDLLGFSSTFWGALGCPKDPKSCITTILAAIDYMTGGCTVEKDRALKACRDGWVYWFDDCGQPYEALEECPCECKNAACVPIELCDSQLTINVQMAASPPCDSSKMYILFTAEVSGGDKDSYTYTWNFGDGEASVLKEDSHAFNEDGNYVVTLTVRDDSGNYGFGTLPVEIGMCSKVSEVIIESNKKCADLNEQITFSSQVTGGDKSTHLYNWVFGDGSSSQEAHPSHTYTETGNYTVSLAVVGTEGGSAIIEMTQKVGACSTSLEVDIATDMDCADTGESVSFTVQIVHPEETNITYVWDFGDGGSSTSAEASHTFTDPGTYTVMCTITDAFDSSATDELTLTVGGCDEPVEGDLAGMIVYSFVDTTIKPYHSGVRIMDAATQDTWDVLRPPNVTQFPVAVSVDGDVIIAEVNPETGDEVFLHSGNWGRNTLLEIGSTCGNDGVTSYPSGNVGIANNTVYFKSSYTTTYYDSLLRREVNQIKSGIMALQPGVASCSRLPVDFDGDGLWENEFWNNTNLGVALNGSTIVFSNKSSDIRKLYAIGPTGGIPTYITDKYQGALCISGDGSTCVFEIEGGEMFNSVVSATTDGKTEVDLSTALGSEVLFTATCLSYDGASCAAWVLDNSAQTFKLAIISTSDGSFSYQDTKNIHTASNEPGGFTSGDRGIVFIGTSDSLLTNAVGDLYYLDLTEGSIQNLTNTPNIHENTPYIR